MVGIVPLRCLTTRAGMSPWRHLGGLSGGALEAPPVRACRTRHHEAHESSPENAGQPARRLWAEPPNRRPVRPTQQGNVAAAIPALPTSNRPLTGSCSRPITMRRPPEPASAEPSLSRSFRACPAHGAASARPGRAGPPKGPMEQHRDEQIDCADCSASFVFSAAEAAVFAERGLAAPKRCKNCRRARKERAASGPRPYLGARPAGEGRWNGASASRGAGSQGARYGAPPRRYTGDVNEYRSPMQDAFSGSPYGMTPRAAAPWQGSGEYRTPMPDGLRPLQRPRPARDDGNRRTREAFPAPNPGLLRSHSGGPAGHDGGSARPSDRQRPQTPGGSTPRPALGPKPDGGSPPRPPARRRPQAEMSAITCDACGAQAEVPFKPAEGREVFCPACYRARRPAT
jgi:CxxC-x17-CxxC domain-containing protein